MTDPRGAYPGSIRHYNLIRVLGQGGMGVVFEGQDRRDGSRVAVKLLHPHLAVSDPTFLERFEREAHVAALLRSPYTVHLLDFGVDDGRYYMVMEFVEGEALASLIARGPVDPTTALRIAAEVARALEEAGARGIVHRDIKPENVLLDTAGRAKVADFGIARSASGPGLTVTGGFVGTPAYAAPEQVDGDVDQRTDIYALGVIIYVMLSGRLPYQGRTTMDTLLQHRTAPLPMGPLAHLPESVQNLVRRCLEKDPLDRYQTASELAAALDRSRRALSQAGAVAPGPSQPPVPAPFSPPAAPPPAAAYTPAPSPPPAPAYTPAPSPPPPVPAYVAPRQDSRELPTEVVSSPSAYAPAAAGPSYAPQPGPAVPPRSRRPMLVLAAVVGLLAAGGGAAAGIVASSGGGDGDNSLGSAEPSPEDDPALGDLPGHLRDAEHDFPYDLAEGRVVGEADAPLTLRMYEDFQCPICLAFTAEDEPLLVEEYVKAGKLRLEFVDLPVLGDESLNAARAGVCAGAQDKFWELHNHLFQLQADKGQHVNERTNVGRFSDDSLRAIAEDLDLDLDAYDACYGSAETAAAIQASQREAADLGISGTPSFVLIGSLLAVGRPRNFDEFRAALDQALADVTAAPTPTTVPATPTPEGGWANITSIGVDGGAYSIAFETDGFPYAEPGVHVHFFFDTVPVEEAGVPGGGPWKLYGGPSPFTGWKLSERPEGATQMCILVANPDHSIRPGTGNCMHLP
jgi:serine/threonine protein kinase/protein-disulfide isomerase